MIIKNVKIYTEARTFEEGEIVIREGLFESVGVPESGDPEDAGAMNPAEGIIDGGGCYAVPGLIDMHFHGCKGYDVCDGTEEALKNIAEYEASVGVTAIAPATMTLPIGELEGILANAAAYRRMMEEKPISERARYADLVGINMEGPFISEEKKGAQNAAYILPCDAEVCRRFLDASEGLVKLVGVAPEANADAEAFIRGMREQVGISLAHTNADYDTAKAAFDAGASHAVHLYNAMPAFTHRAPGVVGAAADSPHVSAEIICDGVHVHPSAVRAAFKLFGEDRMILISDSIRALGMPDGRYVLGGLDVNVTGNRATLAEGGAIAGSATNLADCMRIAVKEMGIPLETAVACASVNPAKKLGIYGQYGSITPGKRGSLVLLDRELDTRLVVKDGVILR